MKNNLLEIEAETKTIIAYYKEQIEVVCRNYHARIVEEQEKESRIINSCEELRKWAEEQYRLIKDPVFIKQAQTLQTKRFQTTTEDINDICNRYKDDIECILKSRVPLWLSSVCYAFSHNWRKRVYEDIIEKYILIEQYIAQEILKTQETRANTINTYNVQSKTELKKINQTVINAISKKVSQKNAILI